MTTGKCPTCGEDLAPGAKFCPECGARIEAPPRETRKLVTVLFADVTGSTALGERLDPEALRGLMTRYFETMRRVIEAHGGTVEKFIGDAVMAVFGIPAVHEDDALRAVRAAAEIRDALAAMNERLESERGMAIRFRTGVNTGEVVAGDPASSTTLVTGDTVNTAARLEQAAQPGEILLGRLTYSLTKDAIDAVAVAPIAAKGKADPLEAWRLVTARSPAEDRRAATDTPLIGRANELATVARIWEQVREHAEPHLITLVAPAGVGKSRVVREVIRQLGGEHRVLVGRALSYGDGITFWPVREVIQQAAGISDGDDRATARERIQALLADAPDGALLAARIAALLGMSEEQTPQEETFWAVRRVVEGLAAARPTILILEDLHWAEDTLLDLVDYIVDLAIAVPLLVLATGRPELVERRPGFGSGRSATRIRLDPLSAAAAGDLLDALPGGRAIPSRLRSRILEVADGTPLFVEEFVALLREDGVLASSEGAWHADAAIDKVAVPATIQALLAARLDGLPEAERRLAQRGSVIGRSFEVAALVELDPTLARDVGRGLLSLVRRELLRPDRAELSPGDAFRFRHVLIRDSAYDALPKSERATLHTRFAGWLERVAGDRIGEFEQLVAYHLAEAYGYRAELGDAGPDVEGLGARARARLVSAARRARGHGDAHASIELFLRATMVGDQALGSADAAALIHALIDVGDFERAGAWIARAREAAAEQTEAERALLRLAEARWASFTQQAGLDPTAAELEGLRTVLEAAGDHVGLAQVWNTVAGEHWAAMRADAAADATERAVNELRSAGEGHSADPERAWALMLRAMGPTPRAVCEARCRAALDDPHAGLRLRAMATEILAELRAAEGRFEEARALYRERQRLIAEVRSPFQTALGEHTGYAIERLAGDLVAGERHLRGALEQLRAIGEQAYADGFVVALAQCLEAQDRDDEAMALVATVKDEGFAFEDTLAGGVRAKILAKRGDVEEAIRLARAAVATADTTDVVMMRADIRLELARVLRLAGREGEASAAATEARELYEQKGIDVMAARARSFASSMGDVSTTG